MLEEVEERTYWALLESGMDSYDLDLTPAQRKEISDAIAIETGMTEEEIGKLAKLIQTGDSDLTLIPWGDIIEENASPQLDTIKTRNMKLENTTHPVTGVPFERVVVEMDGRQVEVVAPEFEHVGEVILTEDLYTVSSRRQKEYCNMDLFSQIQQDPEIGQNFMDEEIFSLSKGKTPVEYVWHHDVHAGRMLLVDKKIHSKTGHTGGSSIWGYKFLSRKGEVK